MTKFIIILILLLVIAFLSVKLYEKSVKRKLSRPRDITENFNADRWGYTAQKLGIIRHYNDPTPTVSIIKDTESKEESYLLNIRPRGGDAITPLTNLGERLRTLTGAVKADYRLNENSVDYRLWMQLPDYSVLDKRTDWDPRYLKNFNGDLKKVPIGLDRESKLKLFRVNGFTLMIGATGSGKGSVLWSMIGAIKDLDALELWGVDLKGGVEFSKAKNLFTRYIKTEEQLLENILELETVMNERIEWMEVNGEDSWPGTKEQPNILLIIDEINTIPRTMKLWTREERDLFDRAWCNIFSKGRAPGISVFAAGQDPRSGDIPHRELFTQFICLKTNRDGEQTLVFGDNGASYNEANTHLWKGYQNDASGRALFFDSESASYTQFKAFYVDKQVVKDWNKEKQQKINLEKEQGVNKND